MDCLVKFVQPSSISHVLLEHILDLMIKESLPDDPRFCDVMSLLHFVHPCFKLIRDDDANGRFSLT